jgi:hypothetical protein
MKRSLISNKSKSGARTVHYLLRVPRAAQVGKDCLESSWYINIGRRLMTCNQEEKQAF